MKKILGIIVLSLLWFTIGIANQLGTNEQLIDYNFKCTLDKDFYIKAGMTTDDVDQLEKLFPIYEFGYKKFTTESGKKFLIFLEYDYENEKYMVPESTVWVVKTPSSELVDEVHFSYVLGYTDQSIWRIQNYKFYNGDYSINIDIFKLDKTTSDNFIKRINNLDKITNIDNRVLSLDELSFDFGEYNTKKTNKPTRAFRCTLFAK